MIWANRRNRVTPSSAAAYHGALPKSPLIMIKAPPLRGAAGRR
jgi:hypothetical protein